ncbi:nosiheptide resistance regulatory protein [Streptomyces collinus]|nr:nosiheptide resistance regulatory protein [Streptomyces collinus]UJA15824.1 nosiheptide resistance regulatory protein [Streptomyces collinus]
MIRKRVESRLPYATEEEEPVTRIDSVRAATGSARDSVLHAAEVVAPYADTAKERAAFYAQEARVRLAPVVSQAAEQAREQYDARLAPRLEQARAHVPQKVDLAAQEAAARTRKAARQAADYSRPKIEQAVAAATPVADEAAARSAAAGAAALAALRGQVTTREIQKLARKHERRSRTGRAVKILTAVGLVAGGAFAIWKWWDKQANPDWLVEPPAATEVPESGRLSSVDGSGSVLDPEVQAKQAEDEAANRDDLE